MENVLCRRIPSVPTIKNHETVSSWLLRVSPRWIDYFPDKVSTLSVIADEIRLATRVEALCRHVNKYHQTQWPCRRKTILPTMSVPVVHQWLYFVCRTCCCFSRIASKDRSYDGLLVVIQKSTAWELLLAVRKQLTDLARMSTKFIFHREF